MGGGVFRNMDGDGGLLEKMFGMGGGSDLDAESDPGQQVGQCSATNRGIALHDIQHRHGVGKGKHFPDIFGGRRDGHGLAAVDAAAPHADFMFHYPKFLAAFRAGNFELPFLLGPENENSYGSILADHQTVVKPAHPVHRGNIQKMGKEHKSVRLTEFCVFGPLFIEAVDIESLYKNLVLLQRNRAVGTLAQGFDKGRAHPRLRADYRHVHLSTAAGDSRNWRLHRHTINLTQLREGHNAKMPWGCLRLRPGPCGGTFRIVRRSEKGMDNADGSRIIARFSVAENGRSVPEAGSESEDVMPKMKTRKSVAKRFKRTGAGKIKRTTACRGHLFTGKTRKRKRQLRKGNAVSPADFKRVLRALGG